MTLKTRLTAVLLLGFVCSVLHAQRLDMLGLRSVNQHGAFRGLKQDAAGNLYTLFNAGDGVRLLKLSADGGIVLAEAHLGQSGDEGVALDVDTNGYIAVAGTSNSNGSIAGTSGSAFPMRADTTTNSFVALFTPALSLQWASFAGSGRTAVSGISATSNAVYVTGSIYAPTLPLTPGGVQQTRAPGSSGNGFVEAFTASTGSLQFATYLTGANGDTQPSGIVVDESGYSYVAGTTSASGFPTVSALVPVMRYAGAYPVSGFVTKLTPAGDGIVFSTFVPGNGLNAIAIDPGKALVVAGNLSSGLFPLMTAQQPIANGLQYQSAVRLSLDGSQVLSSTLLAPADASVIALDTASRPWLFSSSGSAPPLLPSLPAQARGNAYVLGMGEDGKIDRVVRFGGAPVNKTSLASIPVIAGGAVVAADGTVLLTGTVTPTLSSELISTQFYDFPLSGAVTAALPSNVRSAVPSAACGGSACGGSAGLLARVVPDGAAAKLVLSTDDLPNLILRNVGTASAETLRITSATYSVANGCGSSLAPGEECSLALTGTAAGSMTVQADNVPAIVFSLTATTRTAQPLAITPHEVDFGIVTSSSSSATRSITVRNFTTTAQAFVSQRSSTAQTSYRLAQTSSTCASTSDGVRLVVPPNSSCTVSLQLTASGSTVNDGPVNEAWQIGSYDIAVTGYVQASAVSLSATVIDFGRRYVGAPATPRYLFLSNASDSVQAHAPVLSTDAAFRVADECPRALQPHSICRIALDYLAATAPSSDALSLAIDGSTVTVQAEMLPQPSIAGTSANPNLSLSTTSIVFPDPVVVTAASATNQTLTIANTGGAPFALALAVAGDFAYSTDCPAALPAHTACAVALNFTPSAGGMRNGLLTISAGSAGPAYVALSGTALDVLPQNSGLDFGNIPLNTPAVLWLRVQHALVSATATSTDSNFAVALIEDIGYGHGQPSKSRFTASATGSCLNCWLGIQFTPASTGLNFGSVLLASSGAGKATTLVASGTGVPQTGLVLTPILQDFGSIAIHSTGTPALLQLTNLTAAQVTTSGASVSGDFAFGSAATGAADCRSSVLTLGAACLLPVVFHPASTGTRAGQTTIQTSAGPVSATLSGTGTEDTGVSFSPGELAFDNTPADSAKQQTVVVSNTGAVPLSIGIPSITDPHFAAASDCSLLLAGASCNVLVSYSPGSALISGTLTLPVTSSLTGVPSTTNYGIALTALFTVETSGLQIVPGQHTTLNFGAQSVGTASATRLLHVNNLTAQSITVNVVAPRQFAVTASGCAAVPALGSCDLAVRFTPLTTGASTGTILLQGTPSDGSAVRSGLAYLEGYGVGAAQLRVSGNMDITGVLHFGQVASGQTAVQTLTLTNQSSSTSGLRATVRRALSEAPFLTTTTCGDSLAPGRSCTITVTYAPTYQVANTADLATPRMDTSTISVETDAADAPYFIDLAGQVAPVRSLSPAPDNALRTISLSQGSLTFPATPVGSVSPVQSVTVTNTGTTALHVDGIASSDGFSAASECSTLLPDATCTIGVTYRPQQPGTTVGALELRTDSVSSLELVTLIGTGGDASIALSAQAVDFGRILIGRSSTQTVVLTNTGAQDVALSGSTVTGPGFAAASTPPALNPCPSVGGVLPPGGSCTLSISFSPTGTGAKQGTLSVTTSAIASPLLVTLTGNGVAPALAVTPTSLDLGSVALGSSASLSLTLRNGGSVAVGQINFSVSGQFSVSTACGVATLAPASSCAVTITFSPAAAGVATGTLTISSDDPGSPLLVPLSGVGVAPVVTPSGTFDLTVNGAATATVTVQQGLPASFALLATPGTGFAGTVALTCAPDTAATYATCSLLPASLSLGGGPQSATATVTTVTAVQLSQGIRGTRTLLAGLLPIGLAFLLARKRRYAALLILTLAVAISGCGSGGDPRIRYTPVGTYSFHVKATPTTGAATSQEVTLTVVVVPLQRG